ncbi:phosphoribosylanthranilate isomerase [Haliangium ochraceum]|uniref:N-(5'-phosphoribosyl)anthranilate isomerase n=1 Tax=Haliangium ochraceum (strain DSM 14365 / JCM 11303 / SMP-2) TaxID=502025 RepID=D0LX43_HALO1|nr:phosphoribosylanthranilate isomerase [Haliangium ochraceum]ACY16085.1 Phosphoribosylanthranilate isomerase [Haliangium ochraceum DSM 14365]
MIIKLCGLTRPEDAAAAVAAGADWLGLNFWPRSKRVVELASAQACAQAARTEAARTGRTVELVGVFVNQEPDEITALAEAVQLGYVQLHGDESPETCALVRARGRAQAGGAGYRLIRAVAVREPADVATALAHKADLLLVDAPCAEYGGSGRTGDWQLARALVTEARAQARAVLLAGGLRPENVGDAVTSVGPAGVDVASGVESAPGIKDAARMRAFVENARRATR